MITYAPLDLFTASPQIYDTSDFVVGGPFGTSNLPLESLFNNDAYLENRMGRYDGVLVKNDNYTWLPADKRAFFNFQLTLNKTFQLPAASTVLPGTRIAVSTLIPTSNTGLNKCLKVRCDTAVPDYIFNGSTQVPYLYMHDGECLVLIATGNSWLIEISEGNFKTVGEGFGGRKKGLNQFVSDGTLKNRLDYGRMFDWLLTLTDGEQIVPDATWLADPLRWRGCFSWGDGDALTGTTFRVPDERAMVDKFLDLGRNVDLGRLHDYPGGYEPDGFPSHDHVTHAQGGISGSGILLFLSRIAGGAFSKRFNAGGGSDNFGGNPTPDSLMRTGFSGSAQETQVKTIGKIPLIKY